MYGTCQSYPLDKQLLSIAAVTPFNPRRNPCDMSEKELNVAIRDASQYVHWIRIAGYKDPVPVMLGSDEIVPEFDGDYEELLFQKILSA